MARISVGMATFALLWNVFRFCNIGFDLTDESFYLTWSQRPWDYPSSLSQFGFLYHPLYSLVGGDVVLFRQINIAVTLALAFWLIAVATSGLRRPRFVTDGGTFLVRIGLASASLLIFNIWLPTPNYNVLNFQSLLLAGIGIFYAQSPDNRQRTWGWILMGLSVTLVFSAKPSSALVLGIGTLVFLAFTRQLSWRFFWTAGSSFTGSMIALALWTDGSIGAFIERLRRALGDAGSLESGYDPQSLLRWDPFVLTDSDRKMFYGGLIAAFVLPIARKHWPRTVRFFLVLATGSVAIVTLWMLPWSRIPTLSVGEHFGALIGIVALLIVALASPFQSGRPSRLALMLMFLFLPYAYAFGTNTSYASKISSVGFFWIVAALLWTSRDDSRLSLRSFGLPSTLAVLMSTQVFLGALHKPYRQPELNLDRLRPIQPTASSKSVLVDESEARYLNTFRAQAAQAGFTRGTPAVDLTGHSPGLLFFLGAKALGAPWLLGGYTGSTAFVGRLLDRVSCELLSEAWVVRGRQQDPRSLPWSVLERLGLQETNYVHVAEAQHFSDTPPTQQILLKPTRPQASLEECLKRRKN